MKPNIVLEKALSELRALILLDDEGHDVAKKFLDDAWKTAEKASSEAKDRAEGKVPGEVLHDNHITKTHPSGLRLLEMLPPPAEGKDGTPLEVFENLEPEGMEDVVVMMRCENGANGIVSNMSEPAEILLFIEQMKAKFLAGTLSGGPEIA